MCTSNAQAFLYQGFISYALILNPDLSDFFRLSDIGFTDTFYLLQKTGHLLSFGMLYFFVFNWLQKSYKSGWICAVFALSSEIIQLFFQRNGRLFDVGVDLIGIFIACVLIQKRVTK